MKLLPIFFGLIFVSACQNQPTPSVTSQPQLAIDKTTEDIDGPPACPWSSPVGFETSNSLEESRDSSWSHQKQLHKGKWQGINPQTQKITTLRIDTVSFTGTEMGWSFKGYFRTYDTTDCIYFDVYQVQGLGNSFPKEFMGIIRYPDENTLEISWEANEPGKKRPTTFESEKTFSFKRVTSSAEQKKSKSFALPY